MSYLKVRNKEIRVYSILNCFDDLEIIDFLIERNESELEMGTWLNYEYLLEKEKKVIKFRKQKISRLKKILEICL